MKRARTALSFRPGIFIIVLVMGASARAVPSLTDHIHDNDATTWQAPGSMDGPLHQHRDADALTGGNGKYIAYSAWDDRNYRVGGEFGHGYMETYARYQFENDFPIAGIDDFFDAENEWESKVNGSEVNINGVPISISMGYTLVWDSPHEIDVFWEDIGAGDGFATAFWDPGATDFTFDSNPTVAVSAPAGYLMRVAGSADPYTATVQAPSAWHFGGTGAVPDITVNFDLKLIATGDELLNSTSSTFAAYDFYTIALHEIGHGFGLAHFGTGIMRADISSFVMRDPDVGSIDGLKDLYAIAIPLPPATWSGLGLLAAMGVVRVRRLRR